MAKPITIDQLINESGHEFVRVTGDENAGNRPITLAEINRPGLELAGFFEHTNFSRLIIFGTKEITFIERMDENRQEEIFSILANDTTPGLIITRDLKCPEIFKRIANERNFPIYLTDQPTGRLLNSLVNILENRLAPETLIHGVFLNIYGKGVIIKGASGIGKSEIALDLVKRGHLFVADDAVELKEINNVIHGTAPKVLSNLLEIRGIGVIDVSQMFGISSILDKDTVDLIIQLDRWLPSREYTRLGIEDDEAVEVILGVKIPRIVVPVSSGRNMSVIIESAVMNMRLQEYGFDSSKEFVNRVLKNIDENKVGN